MQDLTSKGLPANAGLMLAPAAIATAAGSVSPFLLEDAQADLLVPLVTGGVGMLTVWQERVGKLAVAVAKRDSAALEVKISKVKSLIGLAMITVRAMPTYLGVSTASMTAVALLGHEMPFLLFPALVTSAICMVLTKQRQRRVRRYTERAIREIDGVVPPKTLTGRWWWTLPAVAALIVPASVPIRIMAACSVMAGQIGLIFASSMSQIAASEYYMARTERVFSRADCWSQEASRSSRSLPLTSAAAIVNTILATSLVFVESDIGAIFPFLGLGVFAVSLQNGNTASSSASEVVEEVKTVQELKTSPVPWSEDRMAEEAFNPIDTTVSDSKSSALVATPGKVVSVDPEQNKWADDLLSDVLPKLRVKAKWSEFRETFVTTEPKLSERQLRRLWHAFRDDAGAKGGNREALRAVLLSTDDGNLTFPSVTRQGIRSGLKKAFRKVYYAVSESGPDRRYAPSSAQKAVSSVEADLEELCNSVRSSEKSWRRTGALISLLPATALISPLALSETLVEIILPLVGAALVLFVVAAEADTRSTISASKVWCAQLNQAAATVEELMATSLLYKSRVFALCGMGAAIAIGTIVAEHHWWHGFKMLQTVVQFGMVVAQGTLAAMAVPPLLRVIKQARRAEYMAETSDLTVPDDEAVTPAQFFKGKGPPKPFSKNLRRILTLGAIAPSILLAIFPLGKEFAKRSVASTAGGAFVTALALFLCEVYCAKAEKAQAMRLRTHALANTFAEEAEQQGAVLPLTSAATIAGAALVAFATELNPLVAGSITLLQGISWIVASRKALSTKFESAAATQVNPRVVTKEEGRKRENTGEELSRRIKRATLNMPI